MRSKLNLRDAFGVVVDRIRGMDQGCKITGTITAEIICGKTGKVRHKEDTHNLVTTLGKNLMLNSTFVSGSVTPITTWYIGLISGTSFSAVAAADTMSSHTGWLEDSTHYTAANRPSWGMGTASSSSTTNSSSVNFAINTDGTVIQGIFVNSDNTLGGTTGTLFSAGTFASAQTLFNGDTLKITYTVSLT